MAIRKIKGSWWIDLRLGGTRRRIKSPHQTKDAARDYEAILRTEYAKRGSLDDRLGREPQGEKETPTFGAFSQRWMHDYVTRRNKWSEQRTKQSILRCHLVPFFGRLRLDSIKVTVIEEFTRLQQAKHLSAKTINNHLIVLGKCLRKARDWELLDRVPPIEHLSAAPPETDYLTEGEIERLVAATEAGKWRTAVLLAARTGLRLGEIAGLQWDCVDFDTRRVVVKRNLVRGHLGSTKSNRERSVRLTRDAADALSALPRQGPFVFCGARGALLRDDSARKPLHAACARAGLRRIGWHTLRHSFASELARRGTPLFVIKELLGHATIDVTQRYTHIGPSLLDPYVDQLDSSNSGHQMGTSDLTRVSVALSGGRQFGAQSTEKDHVARDLVLGGTGGD